MSKVRLTDMHHIQLAIKRDVGALRISNKQKAVIRKIMMHAFGMGKDFQRDGYIEVEVNYETE